VDKREPLDDTIPMEQPQWLLKCWQWLADHKKIREAGIEDEIGFSLELVTRLFGRIDLSKRPLLGGDKFVGLSE
jgi:hypothetical protein